MIGRLTGIVDTVEEDRVLIDVGGVAYELLCSARTRRGLDERARSSDRRASLLVETTIRDERIVLFGFVDRAERDCFRLLQKVQGVGSRVSLAILSVLSPSELAAAVVAEDRAAVARADGVGNRLAQRVIAELRASLGDERMRSSLAEAVQLRPGASPQGVEAEAISALVNLGYGRAEAHGAVTAAARGLGGDAEVAALIRAGLRGLSA